jgi:peptidoglycan-associated lipoprotein
MNTTNRSLLLSLAVSFALGAVGCAADKPPPMTARPLPMRVEMRVAKQDTRTPSSGSVHINERIVAACGDLPTAHFAFDSASLEPGSATALGALGRCFTTGPLKGRGMRLVGHADPRGEMDYNLALGQRRAGNVEAYLAQEGVAASQMAALSRGELDATGEDEEGWAGDRKVDVLLSE